MRIAARTIFVAIGVVGLAGSALAADMTAADIRAFAIGKTVYLETTPRQSLERLGRAYSIGLRMGRPSTRRRLGPCGRAHGK